MTHRQFFLAISQDTKSDTCRWTVHRTVWEGVKTTQSALLGSGDFEWEKVSGDLHEHATQALTAALAGYVRTIEDCRGYREY